MRSFITMIAVARHNCLSNAKGGSIVVVLATLTRRVSETTRFLLARLSGHAAMCYATVPVCGDRRSSAHRHGVHAEQHGGMSCQGWRLVKQAPGRSVGEI
jgi:hypothetical protein